MGDVGEKAATRRLAVARGEVRMQPDTLQKIMDRSLAKGDAPAVARIAGIRAAKKTPELIPLCHPLTLTSVGIEFCPDPARGILGIQATVRVTGSTGVEMEALTAASVAALAIYDMGKSVDKGMIIGPIMLMEKHGGESGSFARDEDA